MSTCSNCCYGAIRNSQSAGPAGHYSTHRNRQLYSGRGVKHLNRRCPFRLGCFRQSCLHHHSSRARCHRRFCLDSFDIRSRCGVRSAFGISRFAQCSGGRFRTTTRIGRTVRCAFRRSCMLRKQFHFTLHRFAPFGSRIW